MLPWSLAECHWEKFVGWPTGDTEGRDSDHRNPPCPAWVRRMGYIHHTVYGIESSNHVHRSFLTGFFLRKIRHILILFITTISRKVMLPAKILFPDNKAGVPPVGWGMAPPH